MYRCLDLHVPCQELSRKADPRLATSGLKLRDVLQLPGDEDEQEVPSEGLAPDAGHPTMSLHAPALAGPGVSLRLANLSEYFKPTSLHWRNMSRLRSRVPDMLAFLSKLCRPGFLKTCCLDSGTMMAKTACTSLSGTLYSKRAASMTGCKKSYNVATVVVVTVAGVSWYACPKPRSMCPPTQFATCHSQAVQATFA